MRKGKGKKGGLIAALSALTTNLAKAADVDDVRKETSNQKAVLESMAGVITSVTTLTKKEISLASTLVYNATLFAEKEGSKFTKINNSVQRYLLSITKSKKIKVLIEANIN